MIRVNEIKIYNNVREDYYTDGLDVYIKSNTPKKKNNLVEIQGEKYRKRKWTLGLYVSLPLLENIYKERKIRKDNLIYFFHNNIFRTDTKLLHLDGDDMNNALENLTLQNEKEEGNAEVEKTQQTHLGKQESLTLEKWLGEDNKLGMDIFNKKYRYGNENFEQWLERVSAGEKDVKDMILNKEFIFAGRILSNRGLAIDGKKLTYSNCYVLSPPEDNLESIFDTAKELARTFSYGGGCGVDVSKLRPNGSKVNNAAKDTSGAVSFMDLYSLTTEIIGQKGRRGALMLSMDVSHPDIIEFIRLKSNLDKVTKANISIKVTDEFMRAVVANELFKLSFTVNDTKEVVEKIVNAREVFMELAEQNWNYAEPGILFWDEIERNNLLQFDPNFTYAGVNPCAEEPLPAGGSCLLGSIILPTFVENGEFNTEKFIKAVRKGVHALNDVLDEGLALHPLEAQRDSVGNWRQIGLGILGAGDMLIKMGMKYGSDESVEFCKKLSKTMADEALQKSAELASLYGAYPMCERSIITRSDFFKNSASDSTTANVNSYGLRNSQLLTIAPTGSIGTMLQVSTGVEPNFAFSYTRKTESLHKEGDVFYKVFTKIAEDYMKLHGIEKEEDLPDYFVTAQSINPMDRVKMQGAWQAHIDASISSTVNLKEDATVKQVFDLYIEAWKQGLKGMTVYRAGCAREGILVANTPKKEEPVIAEKLIPEMPVGTVRFEIPEDTIYIPRKIDIGCGKIKMMVGFSPSKTRITDIYVIPSSRGGCQHNIQTNAILISELMRHGLDLEVLKKPFEGLAACSSFVTKRVKGEPISKGKTCGTAMLYEIEAVQKEVFGNIDNIKIEITKEQTYEKKIYEKKSVECPTCGQELNPEGGCFTCPACGYSKCD
jgi:ribonucleoside-diphosphate reductase alpha chain